MKGLTLLKLNTIIIFLLFSIACGNNDYLDQEESGKTDLLSDSIPNTKDIVGNKPKAIDWWTDNEGELPELYSHSIYILDHPWSHFPYDTCEHYISIEWGSKSKIPSYTNYVHYLRMQIQYKRIPAHKGEPDDTWHYLGEEYAQSCYYYGMVPIHYFQDPIDINAEHFPKGEIDIRIRILNERFPDDGTIPYNEPGYNKNLATKWHICRYWETVPHPNPYGFTPTDAANYGNLTIQVYSQLGDDTSKKDVYYTVTMDGQSSSGYVRTGSSESGVRTLKKAHKEGTYTVSVSTTLNGQNVRAEKHGYYNENIDYVSVSFTESDFY